MNFVNIQELCTFNTIIEFIWHLKHEENRQKDALKCSTSMYCKLPLTAECKLISHLSSCTQKITLYIMQFRIKKKYFHV